MNSADEPAPAIRSLIITVTSAGDSTQCSLMIAVQLVNDNPPVVDLSGPSVSTLNHSVYLEYSFFAPASEWIAARDAAITDRDQDGAVAGMNVELSGGRAGDRIYLSETVGCPMNGVSTCR